MTFHNRRQSEKGNILFLILLAVILFAALSYAVTQSLRGGGTDASSERDLVKSAQLTQYPVGIRAAILRMIIDGTDVLTLTFDPPSMFGDSDFTGSTARQELAVFHPAGGGAVFSLVPSELLATASTTAQWVFNTDTEVPGIGTSVTSSANGNDLIAIAYDLASGVCAKINSELGITSVPQLTASVTTTTQQTALNAAGAVTAYTVVTTGTDHWAAASSATANKPYMCVDSDSTGTTRYTYYHVLVER